MKKISLVFVAFFCLFLFIKEAEAKVLPQAAKNTGAVTKNSIATGIIVSPKLRADRRALIVYFANLQSAKSVSYSLTYNTSTQPEGVIGSVSTTGPSSATQELLFGTCSKNVCRYHTGINNARLEVTYTTKVGNKYLKKYKIKV